MNKQHSFLKLYEAGLSLYPKGFREAFAEQMLLTARDILDSAETKQEAANLAIRLAGDLLTTSIKENGKRLGEAMKRKPTNVSILQLSGSVKLGVQIFGVALITIAYVSNFIFTLQGFLKEDDMPHLALFWYIELATSLIPVAMILLTYTALRQSARLTLWSKIVWSYGIGLGCFIGYELLSMLNFKIVSEINIWWHPERTSLVIGIALLFALYYVVSRFVQRPIHR